MNVKKYICWLCTLPLVAICLFSCKEKSENRLSGLAYEFFARSSNYLWADNLSSKTEVVEINNTKGEYTSYNALKPNSAIPLASYRLYINTSNVDYDQTELKPSQYQDPLFSPFMAPNFRVLNGRFAENADPMIEAQLRQHYEGSKSHLRSATMPMLALKLIDYRTTPITNIKVGFSEDFMGNKAGQPLNHLFDVDIRASQDNSFIITQSKKVMWLKDKSISLQAYMDFTPLAPVELFLKLKSNVKLPERVSGNFTVTMETKTGEVLSASARPIELIP